VSQPVVLVAEGLEDRPLAWLREHAEVREQPADVADLTDVEGMVVRSYTTVDAAMLGRAPRLKVVGRGGVGLESIDVAACRDRGVQVVYTPDANTKAVSEFVPGIALQLVRPFHANALDFTDAGFKRLREDGGEHLGDLTIGILGMGRVGRMTAGVLTLGFGCRVIYHDLADVSAEVADARLEVEAVTLDDLLVGCDLLSIHVDGRPGNRHLVNGGLLARSSFRYLVNTSRGLVVDADAVAGALALGRLAGVALDVFDPEPPGPDTPYARLLNDFGDRVRLTPHMASRTKPAVEAMSWVVRDVVAVLEGRLPRSPAP